MIAQAARSADDDVHAARQRIALAPRIHAADARGDPRSRLGVQPAQLALDLDRELARGRDDQRARGAGDSDAIRIAEQPLGEREPESDGLSGTRLRGDQEVAILRLGRHDRRLDRRGLGVGLGSEGSTKRWVRERKGHQDRGADPSRLLPDPQ